MEVIKAFDVNHALYLGLKKIQSSGVSRQSRNGPVLEFGTPVTTTYSNPQRRVLFNPARNHNSVFAWAETLWMLAGRDDLGFLVPMNKNMANYSDDGTLVRGSAYGRRWRSWFGHDQLDRAIESLRKDKDTRRVVIQQWDAHTDNTISSKDVPCNTVIYLYLRPSRNQDGYELDLTVSCRSNDMIYGAYGSNAVHFSILQELIAAAVGVGVGRYHQISNSFHIYTEFDVTKKVLEDHNDLKLNKTEGLDYTLFGVEHHPLVADGETYEDFIRDVYAFFHQIDNNLEVSEQKFSTKWFRKVWTPIWSSFITWKFNANSSNRLAHTLSCLNFCEASDLKLDIGNRYKRLAASKDGSSPS